MQCKNAVHQYPTESIVCLVDGIRKRIFTNHLYGTYTNNGNAGVFVSCPKKAEKVTKMHGVFFAFR